MPPRSLGGACIHVPPPPPNQMIHVSYPGCRGPRPLRGRLA
ncbi:MAG: DUF3299 domain-containing protein [Desulfofustis sp. PB-SRB1]|nr:DUF3299 domain-containing protein [Desulfofustis sp. PB-SRB1]